LPKVWPIWAFAWVGAAIQLVRAHRRALSLQRLWQHAAVMSALYAVAAILIVFVGILPHTGAAATLPAVPTQTTPYVPEQVVATPTPAFSFPADSTPLPTATPAQRANSPLKYDYTFTETEPGGYTFDGTVDLGTPEAFTEGITQGSLTAGSACTINPGADAIVPGFLSLTNETSGFSATPAVTVGWSGTGWGGSISEIEAGFSDGPVCETNDLEVQSTNPVSEGGGFNIRFFVIIPNYYTPDDPQGDTALLSQAQLSLSPCLDPSTDNTITPTSMNGPGVSGTGGYADPFTLPIQAS
jgi:hypothetical protein